MPATTTLRLIVLPFQARFISGPGTFDHWVGPNASLAMLLFSYTGDHIHIPWPCRMSVFKLVECRLRIGGAWFAPGDYPPNVPNPEYTSPEKRVPGEVPQRAMMSLHIPPFQTVQLLGVKNGAEIHGEFFIEPLVVPLDKRDGVLVTEEPNPWLNAPKEG
jgi:hypothetical protein